MSTCVIDNPATMRREAWDSGRLMYSYAMYIFPPFAKKPAGKIFFGANIGPWKTGQIVGDPAAMLRIVDRPSELLTGEKLSRR